jgi:fructuronate reductase
MNQILHLGLGRFHRGHQAVYYQKAGNWKVISSTMRSSDERDKLRQVHLRYPVLELSHGSEQLTWIECIQEALSLQDDLERLMEVFVSPETRIVTLTVTEKGYCLNSSGELDLNHEGIKKDLKHPHQPQTAIGLLALGLMNRKEKLTILSCDNLRDNGKKLENAILKFTEATGHKFPPNRYSFPSTMVDRIVPALLPEKVSQLEKSHQLKNSELIATEKFSQWVIEDNFINGRPDWEKVGVEFVIDVKPYEEMKLRLLNAAHSYLAYAGLNRGYQFVHEAITDKDLHSTILMMLKSEVIPQLKIPVGFDVNGYIDQLTNRFLNGKLPHQLKQIAMDGSQKMPQRIFSSIHEAKKRNLPSNLLMKATREWLEFLWNSRNGKIDDPKADELLRNISAGKEKWEQELLLQLGIS